MIKCKIQYFQPCLWPSSVVVVYSKYIVYIVNILYTIYNYYIYNDSHEKANVLNNSINTSYNTTFGHSCGLPQ